MSVVPTALNRIGEISCGTATRKMRLLVRLAKGFGLVTPITRINYPTYSHTRGVETQACSGPALTQESFQRESGEKSSV